MDEGRAKLLEHAWRHFEFHGQQRTTVFNFYTASAGLTLTGLFYVLATPAAPKVFGIAAGLAAALLSLVFWKLDQRVVQLVKESERVLIALEQALPDLLHRPFERAERLTVNGDLNPFSGIWSYGRSFRLMFLMVAATGLLGAGIAARSLLTASVPETRPHVPICARPAERSEGVPPTSADGTIARPAASPSPRNVPARADGERIWSRGARSDVAVSPCVSARSRHDRPSLPVCATSEAGSADHPRPAHRPASIGQDRS